MVPLVFVHFTLFWVSFFPSQVVSLEELALSGQGTVEIPGGSFKDNPRGQSLVLLLSSMPREDRYG